MKIQVRLFACVLLATAQTSFAATVMTAGQCSSLKGRAIFNGGAHVMQAAAVEVKTGRDYCVARARFADSGLEVEARLPTSGWNGKLVYLGGGGFNGVILPMTGDTLFYSRSVVDDRYAILLSNGGYEGPPVTDIEEYFKASFARDAMKLTDFMFQSVHRALPVGQEMVRLFYGSSPKRSYFEGCSTGGHEAMIEAQRFPGDFDGIVARAPAANFVGLFTQFHRTASRVRAPGGALNPAKRKLLAQAVLSRCDAHDGLADGILSNPPACDFDPNVLRCPSGADSGDHCLSDAQLATVLSVTTPYGSSDGSVSHPGFDYGAEDSPDGWGKYIWPATQLQGDTLHGKFSDAYIRAFVTRDPNFDTARWNANDWLPVLHFINVLFQATDPDLGRLGARGGKLIIWNGEVDTSVSARDNARYYQQVVRTLGQERADQIVELFLAPGVGHCRGGPGPDRVDLLRALSTWVELGTPPSQQHLAHEKYDGDGKVINARPMCKYPAYPRYKGTGDVTAANSFVCYEHVASSRR
jgi:hypothetical protein